jgi:hypothetical protein
VQGEQRERAELLETARAEQDVQREMLKSELREELESLRLEHGEELEVLKEKLSRVGKELMAADKALENKLLKLSEKLTSTEKDLRDTLLAENTKLSSRLEACHQEALSSLSATAAELRRELVSRAALSGIFAANARELGGAGADGADGLGGYDGSDGDGAAKPADGSK